MTRKSIKRVVVKVGSTTVTTKTGRLDHKNLKSVVSQVAGLRDGGVDCVMVTSGAIAAGVEQLALSIRPKEIAKLQAAAAVGQGLLIHQYTKLFKAHGIQAAQILLTQFDMAHRELYLNARRAMEQLLLMGVVPVVNENDTTAVEEIKFGDNDTLAALVAVLVQADTLVILSDIDGLYAADPRKIASPAKIDVVRNIDAEIEAMAEGIGSKFGSGGMITKINAAKIAGASGIGLFIASGRDSEVLGKIHAGDKVGTYFEPRKRKVTERKIWLGYGRTICGSVVVDEGAVKAIVSDGKSLLPAGVKAVNGAFGIGDTIEITDQAGNAVARGLSNYAAEELKAVRGMRTSQIADELDRDFSEEVIHRDFMVLV